AERSGPADEGALRPDPGAIVGDAGLARPRRWWDRIARRIRMAWPAEEVGRRLRSEEALHAMAEDLSAARTELAVEAALLRLVRRLVPAGRVELVRTHDEFLGAADEEEGEPSGPRPRLGPGWTRRRGETMAEIPIRCGAIDHGCLRVLSPAQ